MPPIHAKKPKAMCAHGGPVKCNMGCYADGGDVSKGFNGALGVPGIKSSIKNLSSAPPKLMAEGGEALEDPMDHPEPDGDEPEGEMSDMLADELMAAIEKKDRKGIASAIEAMVMECMSKGGSDV